MATTKATEKEAACENALKMQFPPSSVDPEDAAFLSGNTYLRFARARDGNIEKASAMLKAAIEWRKEFKPYSITPESVQKAMEEVTMVCGGRCKQGCPVIAMELGKKNECTVEERTRQLVYILEETQRKGYDRITWIIDFASLGRNSDERSKATRKETSKILQDCYPERVNLTLLYRPPWYISILLRMAKAFMDQRTAAKIRNAGSTIEELEKFIDRDQIPQICGGNMQGTAMSRLNGLPSLNESGGGLEKAAPEGAEQLSRGSDSAAAAANWWQ